MLLEQEGLWNDLSPKLRTEIEAKVLGYGNRVRYKFNISSVNPDPEKRDGAVLWPMTYTLTPKTFNIVDGYEDRPNKQKAKRIGLIKEVDADSKPTRFASIQISRRQSGVFELNLENPDDVQMAMFLELHPKLKGGKFADKGRNPLFERIDEKQLATEKNTERSLRLKALNKAESMSDLEVVQFADAMTWNSSEPIEVLKSMIADMAEYEPAYFLQVTSEESKLVEYQAIVKRAVDNKVIQFDPAEYKFTWVGSNQVVAVLPPTGDKNEVEKLADYFQHGGDKAEKIFDKIKKSLK